MTAGSQVTSAELPPWAKALIVFVILGFFTLLFGGIALIYLTKKMTLQALDPTQVAKVAQDVAKFPNPLPEGFSYVFGMRVGPVNIVTVEHLPNKQEITFVSEKESENTDAKILLDQAYERGLNLPTNGWPSYAHFKSPKLRGETEIVGEKMSYLIGEISDDGHKPQESFIGSIAIKSSHKSILIFGLQPDGGQYKFDETLDLLKSLHGF